MAMMIWQPSAGSAESQYCLQETKGEAWWNESQGVVIRSRFSRPFVRRHRHHHILIIAILIIIVIRIEDSSGVRQARDITSGLERNRRALAAQIEQSEYLNATLRRSFIVTKRYNFSIKSDLVFLYINACLSIMLFAEAGSQSLRDTFGEMGSLRSTAGATRNTTTRIKRRERTGPFMYNNMEPKLYISSVFFIS